LLVEADRIDCSLKLAMLHFVEQCTDLCFLGEFFTFFLINGKDRLEFVKKELETVGFLALVVEMLPDVVGFSNATTGVAFALEVTLEGLHITTTILKASNFADPLFSGFSLRVGLYNLVDATSASNIVITSKWS
jgi:hypothetical protein